MNSEAVLKALASRHGNCTCGKHVAVSDAVIITPCDDPHNIVVIYCQTCFRRAKHLWRDNYSFHHLDWTETPD